MKEYKAYAHSWIERTIGDAKALGTALSGGSRADAQRAWEKAWGDYMHLGADYGLFGELEEELDGTAGGPQTSPRIRTSSASGGSNGGSGPVARCARLSATTIASSTT